MKINNDFLVEVSAKTGNNLEDVFRDACEELLKNTECETTSANLHFNSRERHEKKHSALIKEKEKPVKKEQKEAPIKSKESQQNEGLHGSKLVKKKETGKIVREKNCC